MAEIAQGTLVPAAAHVQEALETGPPIDHFDARLARCELAAARGDGNATALVAEAIQLAEAEGYLHGLPHLRSLLSPG